MTRFSGKWVLGALLAAIPSAFWYLAVLPPPVRTLTAGASPTISRMMNVGLFATAGILVFTLVLILRKPARHSEFLAFVVLGFGLLFMGCFEWTREAARRPFVINGFMYSNGIRQVDLEAINRQGFLASARWVRIREFHKESLLEIGQDLFKNQCYACHTIGGLNNDILVRTAAMSQGALFKYLENLHGRRYFMPPFAGTADERRALASYIAVGLHGKVSKEPEEGGGAGIFAENCAFCHDAGVIRAAIDGWDAERIREALDNLSALNPAMPDFDGTNQEKDQLAIYLVSLNAPGVAAAAQEHDPGEDVFEENCAMCHTLRGGSNPLLPKIAGWDRERIREALDMLEKLQPAMPPLDAPAEEKDALTRFLAKESERGAQ
jgi:mono/diheme cytochrome c family protein